MKVAKLITVSLTTRVVVDQPDNYNEESDVEYLALEQEALNKARQDFRSLVDHDSLNEYITEFKDDTEIPYGELQQDLEDEAGITDSPNKMPILYNERHLTTTDGKPIFCGEYIIVQEPNEVPRKILARNDNYTYENILNSIYVGFAEDQ